MKSFLNRDPELREFLRHHRHKEPVLRWMLVLGGCALTVFFSMVPAALLFVAINTWSPLKVPLWLLLLPCMFAMTLWLEFENDIDRRRATWRRFSRSSLLRL